MTPRRPTDGDRAHRPFLIRRTPSMSDHVEHRAASGASKNPPAVSSRLVTSVAYPPGTMQRLDGDWGSTG